MVAIACRLVTALRRSAQQIFDRRSIRDYEVTLSEIVRSSHATDDVIYKLDEGQNELNEGPASPADDPPQHGIVIADDLAGPDAGRWPRFAPVTRPGHDT